MATNFWGAGFAKFLLDKLQFNSGSEIEGIGSDGVSLPIVKGSSEFGLITPNRYPLGAGTLFTGDTAQLSLETVNHLSGDSSFKFAPSAVSQEIITPLISLPKRALDKVGKSPMLAQITYAANDPGFKVEVLDQANNVLISQKSIDEEKNTHQLLVNLLTSSTGIKIKIICDVYTASMEIVFDDVVFDDEPFRKIDTISQQNYVLEQPANQHLNLGTGEIKFDLGTATITDVGEALLVANNDDANRTKFIASRACSVTVGWTAGVVNAGNFVQIYKNGTRFVTGTTIDTNSYYSHASGSIDLDKGDFISVGASTQVFSQADKSWLTIQAIAQNDNVVVENADGSEWQSFAPNLTEGTYSAVEFFWKRDGEDMLVYGQADPSGLNGNPQSWTLPNNLKIGGQSTSSDTSEYNMLGTFLYGTNAAGDTAQLVIGRQGESTLHFGVLFSGSNGLSPINGLQNGARMVLQARIPIEGWSATEAHIIPIADPYENDFSARIDASGNITRATPGFIDQVVSLGPAHWRIDFTPGFFSETPSILATGIRGGIPGFNAGVVETFNESATSFEVKTAYVQSGGTTVLNAYPFTIDVSRAGNDYKEPKGYFLGEVATDRFESKAFVTGTTTFNNLVVGKVYHLTGTLQYDTTGAGTPPSFVVVTISGAIGTSRLMRERVSASTVAELGDHSLSPNYKFTAVSTSLSITLTTLDGLTANGSNTVELTECNTHREVSGVF